MKGWPDLPRRLRIGGGRWDVRVRRLRGKYGETQLNQSVVTLDPDQSTVVARDTLLHEVLHAVIANTSLGLGRKAEERLIRTLSPQLLAVLRDNPQLVLFLTRYDD
jgi:hypothetical protein